VKHCILKELKCKVCTASFNSRIQDQECLLRGEPAKKVPTSGWCEKKAFVTSSSHLCIIVRTFANEKMLLFTWNHVSPRVLSWLIIHLKVESCGLSCASAWGGGGCKWLNAVLNLDFYIATIVLFSGMVGMDRFLNCHFPLWTNTLTTCFHTNYISCFLGSSDDMAANLHGSRVTHVSGSWDSPPPIASTLLEKTWKQIWCDQNHKI
jgi:hypothetical protein